MAEIIKYMKQKNINMKELFVSSVFSILHKIDNGNLSFNNKVINHFISSHTKNIEQINFLNDNFKITLKDIEAIYESSLSSEIKNQKGIVFTPEYIIDFLIDNTIFKDDNKEVFTGKIIDPACGCGAFLLRVIQKFYEKNKDSNALIDFIENDLYGIDNDPTHTYITELLINLQMLIYSIDKESVVLNLQTADSIKNDWLQLFNLKDGFDYVLGNPPYVKVQSMNQDYLSFLSETFNTTQNGGFNLFYAFIEQSMIMLGEKGKLGFIVPNNFIKIKSSFNLRKYIKDNMYLEKIIDLKHNRVFPEIMTYNALLVLSKSDNSTFLSADIEKTNNIKKALNNIVYQQKMIDNLKNDKWVLKEQSKVSKYESYPIKLKDYIRTGIATLKDKSYIINEVNNNKYYMNYENQLYEIEPELIRVYYKVSEIKTEKDLLSKKKYIIYPYKFDELLKKPKVIELDELSEFYPKAHKYFMAIKYVLMTRSSSDSDNEKNWIQYGRSQGLNNSGRKLMYPQFLDSPRFILNEDSNSLFSNGFAIYENSELDLNLIKRILESKALDDYIKLTSYPIDGGFYCYQKKYLQNFSIPKFTKDEQEELMKKNDHEFNMILKELYN